MTLLMFIFGAMAVTALITYVVIRAPFWWAKFQNARFQAHLANQFEDWDKEREAAECQCSPWNGAHTTTCPKGN